MSASYVIYSGPLITWRFHDVRKKRADHLPSMTFMTNCPTVPLSTWLKCGFLKNGGTPSHHGFQYFSIQKWSDLGWFGGPMRKTPNPSCLLLPRQAMQPVRSVSFIRKELWPAVTPWRFGVFLFGQRFTTVTATQLLLDMPWGAAAGSSAEWICWSVFHRNMIDN